MENNIITLTHIIYGWIYTKSDDMDRYGNHKTYNTTTQGTHRAT